jgi:hypothetical protein
LDLLASSLSQVTATAVGSSGLSLNGKLGSDSSSTKHPFSALYRTSIGVTNASAPVSSDRVGADDVDIVPFKIETAGSYQISTRNQGDSLNQSNSTIRLFKATATGADEVTNSRIANPATGFSDQHVTTLAAGDYYAAILPKGTAGSKFIIDTDAVTAGLQPGFKETLTTTELQEFSRSLGDYVFEIKAPKLETSKPESRGTAVSLSMSAPVSTSSLSVTGTTKSAAMIRTFNGKETDIKGSIIVDAKTNELRFVPTNPLDMAQPGSYEFRLNKADLKVTDSTGKLVLDPATDNALQGDVLMPAGALQTSNSLEKTSLGTVISPPKMIYVPSFARTFGQPVDLNGGKGIPVTITDATGLRSAKITFEFNPASLSIPSADAITLSPTSKQQDGLLALLN